MMTIRHYVAKSLISGCGLFCLEPLQKGQIVYRFDYRFVMIISNDEVDSLNVGMRESILKYAYRGTGKDRLTGAVYYCIDDSRFMNHSPTPNTQWLDDSETYIATADIPAHTELTCDYADFCEPGEYCFDFGFSHSSP